MKTEILKQLIEIAMSTNQLRYEARHATYVEIIEHCNQVNDAVHKIKKLLEDA